jgi:hypothetical protein
VIADDLERPLLHPLPEVKPGDGAAYAGLVWSLNARARRDGKTKPKNKVRSCKRCGDPFRRGEYEAHARFAARDYCSHLCSTRDRAKRVLERAEERRKTAGKPCRKCGACCIAWNRLVAEPDRVRSLRDPPWIRSVSS